MIEYKSDIEKKRSVWAALWDGMCGRCPNCHQGRLYAKYLKPADKCDKCGEELHHHQADDAPAYFAIFIIGHILVPLVLFIEMNYGWPLWVHASLWLPVALGLSLMFLPIIKGALIGIQWANYMHGFGEGETVGSLDQHSLEMLAIHEANETAPPA